MLLSKGRYQIEESSYECPNCWFVVLSFRPKHVHKRLFVLFVWWKGIDSHVCMIEDMLILAMIAVIDFPALTPFHRAVETPGVSWRVNVLAPINSSDWFGLGTMFAEKKHAAVMSVTMRDNDSMHTQRQGRASCEVVTPRDAMFGANLARKLEVCYGEKNEMFITMAALELWQSNYVGCYKSLLQGMVGSHEFFWVIICCNLRAKMPICTFKRWWKFLWEVARTVCWVIEVRVGVKLQNGKVARCSRQSNQRPSKNSLSKR